MTAAAREARAAPSGTSRTAIGMIAPLLWATSMPFVRRCTPEVGACTTATIGYAVSGVLGCVWLARSRGKSPFEAIRAPRFLPRCALFVTYLTLFYIAISTVKLENFPVVILLNYLWPTFTLFFALCVSPHRVSAISLSIGTLLVAGGIATEVFSSSILGDARAEVTVQTSPYLLALGGAICWGLYTALNCKWGERGGGVDGVPALMLITSVAMLALRFARGESTTISAGVVPPLLYMCVIPFVANVCWDIGTRTGNLVVLSLVCDFIPWVSLTVTALYLALPIAPATWIAAGMIVTGALISRRSIAAIS